MIYKSVLVSWLFETELTNMNAGEGSSNLKEIKTYNNGLPYISGQSMRHALRESIKREHFDEFKCTPEYPCGNIKNCWACDLFGYLAPGDSKRWSPIKASPALGQIRNQITTDLIFRMVEDIECPKCHVKINPFAARPDKSKKIIEKDSKLECPACNKEFNAPYKIMQPLAYKQLIKNLYKSSISIDVQNIGREFVPQFNDDNKMNGFKILNELEDKERINRLIAIIDGIYNLSDFANQSREMVNSSPDFVIISLQENYNHRLASVFKLDESGNIDCTIMKSVLDDVLVNNAKIYVGYISGIIKNEIEVKETLDSFGDKIIFKDNPREVFNDVIDELKESIDESS